MSKDLIRLVHTLFPLAAERFQDACWHPAADVYRTRTGWLIKFDLGDLEFMDSSGLAMLLAVAERISVVELRGPRPLIRRVCLVVCQPKRMRL